MFALLLGYLLPTFLYSLPLVSLPAAFALGSYTTAVCLAFGHFIVSALSSFGRIYLRTFKLRRLQAAADAFEILGHAGLFYGYWAQSPLLETLKVPALLWSYALWLATPLTLVLEGFASFVLIYALGRTARTWATTSYAAGSAGRHAHRSDGATLISLALVGLVVPTVYLYSLYAPAADAASSESSRLTVGTSALVGASFTAAGLFGLAALGLNRGTIVDLAALWSYTAFGTYFALQSSAAANTTTAAASAAGIVGSSVRKSIWRSIKRRIVTLPSALASKFTSSVVLPMASLVTPYAPVLSVLNKLYSFRFVLALLYRIGALVGASYYLRQLSRGQSCIVLDRTDGDDYDDDDDDDDDDDEYEANPSLFWITNLSEFTRPLWLMVYTHTLLYHFKYSTFDDAWWRWLSTFICICMYGLNLAFDEPDPEGWDSAFHLHQE
ncbi:hypothetical protein H4R33_005717 [Dimargaris cristalligena]|uniref:ICE2-domain-containing protein n=1 Tax=Dimargaris cristalligena TaxID=215637 RepID=A0A4P9ZVK8_9FUNG|nr:hypothetical protein H4R33_005717 [Dimargaris cristalligena]RKP36971.1 hypothetical protein BJ085DRAFT_34286 [Dimargaris cristalligena]|eukprot:RKP36971.1 hypothetical protein BJ085DRAFT_34286 [Dimargaris cristalligena]